MTLRNLLFQVSTKTWFHDLLRLFGKIFGWIPPEGQSGSRFISGENVCQPVQVIEPVSHSQTKQLVNGLAMQDYF